MKVYEITPDWPYLGGVILVAATCKEEALAIAFPEDEDGYKENLAYWSEPQLIEVLNADVSEPQVITRKVYID